MPVMKLQAPKLKENPTTEEFIFFLRDFEEMVNREGIPPIYVMKYLIQAIQSQEMKNIIQSYSSTIQGYHQAIQTLKVRYGDEERLKVEKMEEVERFSLDCKTSIGLFKLSAKGPEALLTPNMKSSCNEPFQVRIRFCSDRHHICIRFYY